MTRESVFLVPALASSSDDLDAFSALFFHVEGTTIFFNQFVVDHNTASY